MARIPKNRTGNTTHRDAFPEPAEARIECSRRQHMNHERTQTTADPDHRRAAERVLDLLGVTRSATIPTRAPRLLTKQDAAAYVGVSPAIFDQVCDVRPVELAEGRSRLIRFDVVDLDAWIDRRKGHGAASGRRDEHLQP